MTTRNEYIVLLTLSVFPDIECSEQWQLNAISGLEQKELIRKSRLISRDKPRGWSITDRGKCLLDHIDNLNLLQPSWSMP